MPIDVEATLQAASTQSHFEVLALTALQYWSAESWETEQSGQSHPASDYASIWSSRLKMGRFDSLRIKGVAETATSLGAIEGPVWLAVSQSASGRSISVWVDDQAELVGLIVGEKE